MRRKYSVSLAILAAGVTGCAVLLGIHRHNTGFYSAHDKVQADAASGVLQMQANGHLPLSSASALKAAPAPANSLQKPAPAIPGAADVPANSLALDPVSATIGPGGALVITLYENSGPTAVNAVQAKIIYDPAQLEYVATDLTGSFGIAAASDSGTPGVIRLARATKQPNVIGKQPVSAVTFRVKAGVSGTVTVKLDAAGSLLMSGPENTNILQSVWPASYLIAGP